METLVNVLEILKYLALATAGSALMCLAVSALGGLLEKFEGTTR